MVPVNYSWGASWPPVRFYGAIAAATWNLIEPEPGTINFKSVDDLVAAATNHHEPVVLIIGSVPTWAFCKPHKKDTKDLPSEPTCKIDAWRDYVRLVVKRYRNSGIEAYEPWNEPNNLSYYHGSIDSLVEMNRIAYEVIKQEQPSAIVLTSGINAQETSWVYLENYAKAGGLRYADILAEHFYVSPGPPEAMLRKIRIVQRIVQRYRPGMPIWNTEMGWRIHNHDKNVDDEQDWAGRFLTDRESVAYVGRAYLLTWAAGVDRLYWYSWGHRSMGLNEYNMETPKPAARAYEMIEKWMVGHRLTSCARSSSGVWTCDLDQDGDRALVAWSENEDVNFLVPKRFEESEELAGTRVPLTERVYQLGIVPVKFSMR